ncbi:MAG TPA: SpoIIE family protein phosphatase [Candidatus Ozemobacteraceae bacterium]|nr:SpoIIE family protein phosphatase [Candidatus Ozemobacteraceae bacterium]
MIPAPLLSRVVRWLGFTVCFLAFPLMLVNVGLQHGLDSQWQAYLERCAARMVRQHDLLTAPAADRSFFYRDLERLVKALERNATTTTAFTDRLSLLQKKLPGLFDLYLTDGSGELLYPRDLPPVLSRFALKKLHETLGRALLVGAPKPLRKHQKLFTYFWGETIPWVDLSALHDVGELLEVSPVGRRSFFFYSFRQRFALFAHVNLQAVPPHFPLRVLTSRASQASPDQTYGVAGVGEHLQNSRLSEAERQFVERGLVEFETSPREYLVSDDLLLVVTALDPSFRLWSLSRLPPEKRGDLLRRRTIAYSVLVFLVTTVLSGMIIVGQYPVQISIQSRLTGILGFAIGLPLVVILVMGYDYLWKSEQTLIHQAFRNLEESLRSLDEKFPQLFRHVHQRIKNVVKRHRASDGVLRLEPFNQELIRRQAELGFYWHLIVNADGDTLYVSLDQKGQRRDDTVSYSVTSEMLRRLNRSLGFVDSQKIAGRGSTSVFLSEDRSFKLFMKQSMKRFNQFNRYFDRIFLFEPVWAADGRAEMMICFNFKPRDLFFLYLKQDLLTRQRQVADSQILAVNPEFPDFDTPAGAGKADWIKQFIRRVQTRKALLKERLWVDGREILAAAAPSQSGDGYYLVQTVPVATVINSLTVIRWNLGLFIGISLLMVMAVGSVLARHFLLPIKDLGEGVLAIQESRYRHRIPTHSRDELGQLSLMFNQTLERLEELSLARTVQGRLFPQQMLEVGEWRVYGRCVTATELGGDYYDYFAVGDEYLVVVIGDVAGHGTSAALLMAMAKAGLTLEVKRDVSPVQVLGALNSLLHSSDKRRKLLTFFYAVIQVASGEVRYGNAGHNRPLFFRRGVPPVELKSHGLPLGSRKNVEFRQEAFTMAAGDRLWLYTDGIPETPGHDQEPLGYERMAQVFAETASRSFDTAVHTVFQHCDAFRAGAPQADDMTLILVERTSTPTTHSG